MDRILTAMAAPVCVRPVSPVTMRRALFSVSSIHLAISVGVVWTDSNVASIVGRPRHHGYVNQYLPPSVDCTA